MPDNKLLVDLITDHDKLRYINGSLFDLAGNEVDGIRATVSITNISDDVISDVSLELFVCTTFNFGNGQESDKKVELAQLERGSEERVELNLYLQQNSLYWNGLSQMVFLELYVQKEGEDYTHVSSFVDIVYALEIRVDNFTFGNHVRYFDGYRCDGEHGADKGTECSVEHAYIISNEARRHINWFDLLAMAPNEYRRRWNGACYGISAMISSFASGDINPSAFGGDNVHDLRMPQQNIDLRDTIHIMQLSQFSPRTAYASLSSRLKSEESRMEELVSAVQDISNGGFLPVFNYRTRDKSFHSVVGFNIIENNDYYEILVLDPNYPTSPRTVRVRTDYSSFEYMDGLGEFYETELQETITNKILLNVNTFAPEFLSSLRPFASTFFENEREHDFISIVVDTTNEIRVQNLNNEFAYFKDYEVMDGNLHVINVRGIPSGNGVLSQILIPNTEENQTLIVKNVAGGELDLIINNNYIIGSVLASGGSHKVTYNSSGMINFASDENSNAIVQLVYTDLIGDTGVYSVIIDATNTKSAYLSAVDNGVVVFSDSPAFTNIIFDGFYEDFFTQNFLLNIDSPRGVLFRDIDGVIVGFIDSNDDESFGTPTDPTPIEPTEPNDPASPTGPTEPNAPASTSDPNEQNDLINPTAPTVPTEPIAPTVPTVPAEPTAPTDPAETIAPTDPSESRRRLPLRSDGEPSPVQPTHTPILVPTPNDISVVEALHRLGLFVGTGTDTDGNPVFELERPPTRLEALALVIRLMGLQQETMAFTELNNFTDVPAWGDRYAAYGYHIGITVGTNDDHTEFTPNRQVTAHEFTTFLLRVLGYSEANGDFFFEEAMQKASIIGFFSPFDITWVSTDNFLRYHAIHAMTNALLTIPKDSNEYLLHRLVGQGVFSREDADWFIENISS